MSAPADRPTTAPARARLTFGRFVLDPSRAELLRDGEVVPLRRKAFDLLQALTARPGEVLTKDELLAAVWPGVVVGEDSLAQCVHELRAALGEHGAGFVRTVPRRGYRFDGEVRVEPAAAAPVWAPDANAAAARSAASSKPAPIPVPAPGADAEPVLHAGRHRWAAWVGAALLALLLGQATLGWQRSRQAPVAEIPSLSIVVLPLTVEEPGETPAWFAEGLTADLTAELGRLANAFVIARATAAAWRGTTNDPREVARALGVRYVVRGSVRRAGEQVQLALSLVDGTTGAQQWAERFELERASLGPALDEVVLQIARRLNVEMYRAGGAAAALDPEQVKADDLAMQGWGVYFRGSFSRETLLAALPLFEQAVAKDPRSVLGWGGVAVANGFLAAMRWAPDRDAAIARLTAASAHLQELDAEHLFALLAKFHEANVRGDLESTIVIAKLTIERYPNHAPSHGSLAIQLLSTGRFA